MAVDAAIPSEDRPAARVRRKPLPWYAFGLANLVVVLALGVAFWYLLIDPAWSPVDTYPFPYEEVLFWAILLVVFLGFNLEYHWFDRLRQPWRGLAMIGATAGLAIGITALLAVWGNFDPAFAANRPDGMGFFTPALYVLFGFFTYLTIVINWNHWPWQHKGLKQPWLGIAEIVATTTPTVILFLVFGMTNQAVWAKHSVLSLPTTVGWFYDVIVIAIITGLLTENWPWRLTGTPGRTAVASLAGNVVFGTGLFFAFLELAKVLLGGTVVSQLGPAIGQYPAELGVCWVFWMIMWANAFHNWPNTHRNWVNYIVRIAVTLALGIVTFVFYYFVFAPYVAHEPAVAGNAHGNALGWMNWLVLWSLFYVVYLGSYGIPGHPEESADAEEHPAERLDVGAG